MLHQWLNISPPNCLLPLNDGTSPPQKAYHDFNPDSNIYTIQEGSTKWIEVHSIQNKITVDSDVAYLLHARICYPGPLVLLRRGLYWSACNSSAQNTRKLKFLHNDENVYREMLWIV